MKAVKIVNDPKVAELLVDPMRRTIVSILADNAMTETQLAELLTLTESAVGYHLRILEEAELVRLVKKEPESHGILQKFYRSSALYFVIDSRNMPFTVSRYFFPVNIERIRGMMSILQGLANDEFKITSATVEQVSDLFGDALVEVAEKHVKSDISVGRETFIVSLYTEALMRLARRKDKLPPSLHKAFDRLMKVQAVKSSRSY